MGKLGSSTERRVLARMVREPEAILDALTCRGVVLWCWTEIKSVC